MAKNWIFRKNNWISPFLAYNLLGVDFESFNPTASNFWLKYFTEYTHSVVRRIDDLFI